MSTNPEVKETIEERFDSIFDHKFIMIAHTADKGDDKGPHGYGELLVRIRGEIKQFIRSESALAVREALSKMTSKIDDICEEFGSNPEQCLGIISEQLHGRKEELF